MIEGKIFSTKGALQNLLLGFKDEWERALDASAYATKADADNEFLKLFSFFSDAFAFLDTDVATFSDEGWVSREGLDLNEIYFFLALFFEASATWYFLKESTRREFELRLEVFEFRLEEFKFILVSEEDSELEEDRRMDLLNEQLMLDSDEILELFLLCWVK